MTDENKLEGQSRRKFLKTTGAVGVAATGVGAFAGATAAQEQGQNQGDVIQDFVADQVSEVTQDGLVNVNVTAQLTDTADVQNVQVQVGDVLETVTVSDVIDVTLEDVNANATVVVQALNSGGQVVDTATSQITN